MMDKTYKQNKVCIITGGNRGIGEYITRVFVENGFLVIIGATKETSFLSELGDRVKFQKADVRIEKDHFELINTALKWAGNIDVYINNAGLSEWCGVDNVSEAFWNKIIDTNLKGTFWGCKAAASVLKKGGSIINISSIAGKRGSSNNSVYCASKFGVNGITQALAKELGPKGIRVNAVCPVYIKTEGVLDALKDKSSPASGKNIENYLKEFALINAALKRLPTGREVAELCIFLSSDNASAITGQCINVDCGVLPQ